MFHRCTWKIFTVRSNILFFGGGKKQWIPVLALKLCALPLLLFYFLRGGVCSSSQSIILVYRYHPSCWVAASLIQRCSTGCRPRRPEDGGGEDEEHEGAGAGAGTCATRKMKMAATEASRMLSTSRYFCWAEAQDVGSPIDGSAVEKDLGFATKRIGYN